jgi:hypothetical protein
MKYYVTKTELGEYTHINETEGRPVNMSKFLTIELPPSRNGMLTVISRGRDYPDYKVAYAVAAGQIKLEDVK